MPQPLQEPEPDTVSEETAEVTVVDEGADDSVIRDLPAERTEAPDIEDTGRTWEQRYPGESMDQMPTPDIARILATRISDVSDTVLFGATELGPDEDVFQLVPQHRDRLRVTLEAVIASGEPTVYIGSDRNLGENVNGWQLISGTPITIRTRDAIYCKTVGGADTARVQWAAELRNEGHNV